ncbi:MULTISPECIES: FMN-dependent NADH-azoreductase [Streptomycetaceae]|uniref:FMN dependent NADH:quinone oxidoreductase n=1 Tax=Streptantibioticus cattleyicolor (strain ATCC 35852 / DSM 46488 / JCM 4925 / NBRC 14057 / NRRL 8057) TaxID=1003195 RepID=F8JSC7_STREN|nr:MULTISPECIES: NAD(P)H-dependent oxidoreductase [Streptomycetaceae]AEW95442.1 acyl carrier protein phosphodiesterase [Streptantibioticus cattleyicolor NRRL 8057 = DSM 46488]MYS60010.1 FMN-dependent NADH-azoreductase [Streptomyces sp. SID5468]CCB75784.1 FMN-dependent NADH-azoreductase [Streptantibioticus cattleyicolor NRRL 8057 = DSM 46488]
MATLLHIDSSLFPLEGSTSRQVTATFRKEWEAQHPEGKVIYRDLAAEPVPHLELHGTLAGFAPAAEHTPEQAAAFALRDQLARELEEADAVLIGAPMYNFTIPSTLKAWLDHVILMGRTVGEQRSAAGKPTVVVASRGGGYGPGTPRESFEFVTTYLDKVLAESFGLKVDYIVPELTLARSNPAMADLVELADASKAKAHEEAAAKAKELAVRLAAK